MTTNSLADFYQHFLNDAFIPAENHPPFNPAGRTWRLSPQIGEGYYWVYAQKDLFDIKIHDFYFYEDAVLEFHMPECLSITHYDSISGEELAPYRKLTAGCIKTFIGNGQPYRVHIHQKIPIRSIGIEITPAYYEDYLKKQYPDTYTHPLHAFQQIGQTMVFPQITQVLQQVRHYQGDGIAAALFYEGKVAEMVSLVVEEEKRQSLEQKKPLSSQDIAQLNDLTAYLNDHYAEQNQLDHLAQLACMGKTKLKTSFKQLYGCTITEYLQHRRMSQAEFLLSKTDLPIKQVAQSVGYSTSSRFAELFRKNTGLLPADFRKLKKT